MEVILKQDVQGLGYKNDTVKVRPGYGRNYLIPNGVAIIANDSNKRMMNENIRQAAHKAAKLKQDAEALAQKIGELTVEIGTKAGETGKIFGAVTPFQVADALKAKGFEVDRKKIIFKEQPKQLG
ncbi:MAG TPA: 50S ribosomal protein L9, partial [Cyclobacteriaceae bacterium]|nr:50S ribosomal protein L9 [Cyclobacteriaceae bacterium]